MNRFFKKTLQIYCFVYILTSVTNAQEIKYSANFPSSMKAGETTNIVVDFTKGNLNSFAKFQIDLPAGFNANPLEIKGGSWTFDQQRAKIVWVSMPAEPNFTIKIKLTASKYNTDSATINTKLFFLEENVKKEFGLSPFTVNVVGSSKSETENKNEMELIQNSDNLNQAITSKNSESKEDIKNKTKEQSRVNNLSENTKNEVKNNSLNESEKIYRLQIGAFLAKPIASKFKEFKDFWYYEDNGYFKVTVGKFSSLSEAEAFRAEMKTKGTDGFIVAFKNNVRVKNSD